MNTHGVTARKCSLHWLRNRSQPTSTEPNLLITTVETACYEWQWTCKATNKRDLQIRAGNFVEAFVRPEHKFTFLAKFGQDWQLICLLGHMEMGITDPLNDTASNGVEGMNNGLSLRTVYDSIRGKMPDEIVRGLILKVRCHAAAYRAQCVRTLAGTTLGLRNGLTETAVREVIESVSRGVKIWSILPWTPIYEGRRSENSIGDELVGWSATAQNERDGRTRALTIRFNGDTSCPCGHREGKGMLCSELNR